MTLNQKIPVTLKTGNESFYFNDRKFDFKIIDFWKWNTSDLVSNATRGRLAEFIVAKALKIDTSIARVEWQAYDLITRNEIKIEVKSASYIQSWNQKELSKISFSIKKSRTWNPDTNKYSNELSRNSDAYIFALLKHKNKDTIDPLNLEQWKFYILTTEEVNNYKRSEHSITLKSLEKIAEAIGFDELENMLYQKLGKE